MVRNLQYSVGKRTVEEAIRLYGGNLEYTIPATLYLLSPLTRNFTIRQIGSLLAESWKFKKNITIKTGRNILMGSRPIGWTAQSGTGYVGRTSLAVRSAVVRHPIAVAATAAVLTTTGYTTASEIIGGIGSPHASGFGLAPSHTDPAFFGF